MTDIILAATVMSALEYKLFGDFVGYMGYTTDIVTEHRQGIPIR